MEARGFDGVTEAVEISDGKKLAGVAGGDGGVEAKSATTAPPSECDPKKKKIKNKKRRVHVSGNKRPLFFYCNYAKLITEVGAVIAKVDELPTMVTQAVKQGIEDALKKCDRDLPIDVAVGGAIKPTTPTKIPNEATGGTLTKNLAYKSDLCRNWENMGSCSRKGDCIFAHGLQEVRTPLCLKFQKFGFCPDEYCRFRHSTE